MQVEIKVPVLPESVTEGTLGDWHKQVGDSVAVEENIVDLETDKVVLEIVASSAGVIESIAFESGATVKTDDVLGIINTEAGAAAAPEPAAAPETAAEAPAATPAAESAAAETASGEGKASPAVRKLLAEHNLDAANIEPSGKKGAITKADVERHLQQQAAPAAAAAVPEQVTPSAPTLPQGARNDRRVPMSRLRARIAERLKQAQNTAAMLTTFNEVNLKPMMDARAQYRDAFEKAHGVKLGMMSFFTSAAVEALKRFPAVNASIDGDDIVYHDYFDIGIAVSSDRGLASMPPRSTPISPASASCCFVPPRS